MQWSQGVISPKFPRLGRMKLNFSCESLSHSMQFELSIDQLKMLYDKKLIFLIVLLGFGQCQNLTAESDYIDLNDFMDVQGKVLNNTETIQNETQEPIVSDFLGRNETENEVVIDEITTESVLENQDVTENQELSENHEITEGQVKGV